MKTQAFRMTAVLVSMAAVAMAAPPKPVPVTATFRCPTAPDCIDPDRIAGDAAGPIVGNTGTSQGAFISASGDFSTRLDPVTGRTLDLDFTVPDGPAPCLQTTVGCRRTFTFATANKTDTATNCVTSADVPLPNGLYDIPIGGWSPARFKLNFADPDGRSYLWTVRFNPGVYAGSSFVKVTRLSANVWEVEATAEDRARLVSTTTSGKQVMTDEGLFVMPFKIRVVK